MNGTYLGFGNPHSDYQGIRTAEISSDMSKLYGGNLLHLWFPYDKILNGNNIISISPRTGSEPLVNYNSNYFIMGEEHRGFPSFKSPDNTLKKLVATPAAGIRSAIVIASCDALPFDSYRPLVRQGDNASLVGEATGITWISAGLNIYKNGLLSSSVSLPIATYESIYSSSISTELSVGGYELYGNNPWMGNIYMIALLDIEQSVLQRADLAIISQKITG